MERIAIPFILIFFVVLLLIDVNSEAFKQGKESGSQNPLGVQEDIKQCEQEYRTKCSFEVLVYPIEE